MTATPQPDPNDLEFKITGFRLENFGPFVDTGPIALGGLFTFVVGANNTGKSWVLRGLVSPSDNPNINGLSSTLTLRFEGNIETGRRVLMDEQNQLYAMPAPMLPSLHSAIEIGEIFKADLEAAPSLVLYRRFSSNTDAGSYWMSATYKFHEHWQPGQPAPNDANPMVFFTGDPTQACFLRLYSSGMRVGRVGRPRHVFAVT